MFWFEFFNFGHFHHLKYLGSLSIHPQSKLSELRQKAYKTDYNQNQTQSLHIFSCLGPDKEQGVQNYEIKRLSTNPIIKSLVKNLQI